MSLGINIQGLSDNELGTAAISSHFNAVRLQMSVRECPGRAQVANDPGAAVAETAVIDENIDTRRFGEHPPAEIFACRGLANVGGEGPGFSIGAAAPRRPFGQGLEDRARRASHRRLLPRLLAQLLGRTPAAPQVTRMYLPSSRN
jgi:hypothetical protein